MEVNLSTIDLLRLFSDFGMLVLIWLVQMVIYPSFTFYKKENFLKWHEVYMKNSPLVIIPLMLGQLILVCLQLYFIQNTYTLVSLAIVFILWGHTFYQFAPLHNAIKNDLNPAKITSELVKFNWWRTFFWTVLFVYSFFKLVVFG
ncbi:MAG: hypothetical protein WA951_08210 [Leeuwenhoekiella sp.]